MNFTDYELIDKIWNDSYIIFDTSSIFRLYEWQINKSLILKDIFDCKTENIWITEQIKKELEVIYNNRLHNKKKKFSNAIKNIKSSKNKEKFIAGLLKQCEGFGYPDDFICSLREYINVEKADEKLADLANRCEEKVEVYFKKITLKQILRLFFSNVYKISNTDKLKVEEFTKKEKPPGYKDINKKSNNDGDYIIWKEIIDLGKEKETNITFVTADVKSDWFEYDKKQVKKIPRQCLIKEFKEYVDNGKEINIITITDFLEIAANFISEDINDLINESRIIDLINEKYTEWYPEELAELVEQYIEENSDIHDEVVDAVECCVDNIQFGELQECNVRNVDHNIYEGYGYVEVVIDVNFELSVDASAHCSNEDFYLGSPTVIFDAEIKGLIDIDWESEDTKNKTISDIYDIEIQSLELNKTYPLYGYDECASDIDDYEDDYEDEEYFYDEDEF